MDWKQWVGLPHEIGADPRKGKAACCLQITKILLEDIGYTFPFELEMFYRLAREQNLDEIRKIFAIATEKIEQPEAYCVTLFTNESLGLGIGIVVPDEIGGRLFLLVPHHRRGVMPVPVDILSSLDFARVAS